MRLTGLVYRAHNPRWAFLPDSGDGAARFGGRFNPPGLPTLYTARRLETAWLEAQQAFPFKAQPMTMVAYEVDCAAVVDLTDPAERATHGIDGADLACAWEDLADQGKMAASWRIVQRLHQAGHVGILVPSFAPGASAIDINAVFWTWGPMPPHQVRVIDDAGRLPRNDLSWR